MARLAVAHGLSIDVYAASLLEQVVRLSAAEPVRVRTPEEIRSWLDELAALSDKIPPRPGETFSRDMIYQDHP